MAEPKTVAVTTSTADETAAMAENSAVGGDLETSATQAADDEPAAAQDVTSGLTEEHADLLDELVALDAALVREGQSLMALLAHAAHQWFGVVPAGARQPTAPAA